MYSLSQPWHPACCLLWGCTQPMLADFPKKPLLHQGLQSSSCGPGSSHAFKRRNCGQHIWGVRRSAIPRSKKESHLPLWGVLVFLWVLQHRLLLLLVDNVFTHFTGVPPLGGLFVTVLGVLWMHHLSLISIHEATMSSVSLLRVMWLPSYEQNPHLHSLWNWAIPYAICFSTGASFVPLPRGACGNIWRHFDCYNPEVEGSTVIQYAGPWIAAKYPTMFRISPTIKKYPCQMPVVWWLTENKEPLAEAAEARAISGPSFVCHFPSSDFLKCSEHRHLSMKTHPGHGHS